jgi:hypothetical protein
MMNTGLKWNEAVSVEEYHETQLPTAWIENEWNGGL